MLSEDHAQSTLLEVELFECKGSQAPEYCHKAKHNQDDIPNHGVFIVKVGLQEILETLSATCCQLNWRCVITHIAYYQAIQGPADTLGSQVASIEACQNKR